MGEAYLKYHVQLWDLHYKNGMNTVGRVQQKVIKMIKGLKHLTYKERLRELDLEKRWLGGVLSVCINT